MQKTDREAAEIILNILDRAALVTINWNLKEQWLSAIMKGLKEARKA
ncbi:hypothetical protein [Aminipila sp.]|nr:hypothetical protein [Aminipila sp.]